MLRFLSRAGAQLEQSSSHAWAESESPSKRSSRSVTEIGRAEGDGPFERPYARGPTRTRAVVEVTSHRSQVTRRRSQVAGRRAQVIDRESQVISRKSQAPGHARRSLRR